MTLFLLAAGRASLALALGAVAAVSSSSEDLHCVSAWGAAALGSAALATGLVKYRRVVDLGDGISNRDVHAVLGGLGEGEDDDDAGSSHAGVGGGSLAAMTVSVVVLKFSW